MTFDDLIASVANTDRFAVVKLAPGASTQWKIESLGNLAQGKTADFAKRYMLFWSKPEEQSQRRSHAQQFCAGHFFSAGLGGTGMVSSFC